MARIIKGALTFNRMSRFESLSLAGVRHGCHVMFHAPVENVKLFDQIPIKNTILMQMRFDGRLGFPGGFVDATDKTLEEAVNRESAEELGCRLENAQVNPDDYITSHYCDKIKFCVHFFSKRITFEELHQLERRPAKLQTEGGFEVLGMVRVPLYCLHDKKGGFRAFSKNNFVGIAKEQLIIGIAKNNLLPNVTLENYLSGCPESYVLDDLRKLRETAM
eukprot:gene6753-7512_t